MLEKKRKAKKTQWKKKLGKENKQLLLRLSQIRDNQKRKHTRTKTTNKNGHAQQKCGKTCRHRRYRSRVQAKNRGQIQSSGESEKLFNGVVAMALMYHPLVLLSVFLPKKIVGNEVVYDIHNLPILATNGMQFLIVLFCAHASRQVPSKEKRVLSLSSVLILLGVLNIVFALIVRFREHPDVVDHKKVAWIGAVSIEKVMKKLIGTKRCESLGVRANKMYPSLAQLEVFGEIMSVALPVFIRGMAKALISHGVKNARSM